MVSCSTTTQRRTTSTTSRPSSSTTQATEKARAPAPKKAPAAAEADRFTGTSHTGGARAPEDARLRSIARTQTSGTPTRGLQNVPDGGASAPALAPSGEEKFLAKDKKRKVKSAERMLRKAGFKPGKVDGRLTERSRQELEKFQRAWGLEPTGELDRATFKKLKHTSDRMGDHKQSVGIGQRGARVLNAEKRLRRLGYDTGKVDGVFDRQTADAVKALKRDQDNLDSNSGILGGTAQRVLRKESKALNHDAYRRRVKPTKADRRKDQAVGEAARRRHANGEVGIGEGSTRERVVAHVQKHLRAAGFSPKRVDGTWDERTTGVLKQFQKREGLDVTGRVNGETWRELKKATLEAKGPTSPAQRMGERSAAVKRSEKILKELGYNPGKVDGLFDRDTQRASRAFERKHDGTGDNGAIGTKQLKSMKRALKKKRQPNLNTIRGCAQFLLRSKNVSFWDGLSTGSDRANLQKMARNGKGYVNATGQFVKPKLSMMRALVEMAKKGPIQITALTGGVHSPNSNHYRGTAVDLSIYTGSPAEIERIANKYGGYRNFETDHIHLDF